MASEWKPTACILCSINCGIEVQLDGRRLTRIRGDKANPRSHGYTCEKALRLDQYQNGRDRLTTPLRRRPDGGFEPIDWDTAIAEVARELVRVRETHGGDTIFYYGGGGQANHLGGAYASATRRALGSVYASNALAQEKTGEFWVDGQLYGRPRCHTTGDFEHAEVAMFVGKNPWQSHGFPRARAVLREIAADPNRALIVIDPRRTETAEIADYFLQVRPGADVFLLSAMLAMMLEEDLIDHDFLAARTTNGDALFDHLRAVPIADHCARAGVAEQLVRTVARRIARAASVSIFEDLGIQQAPHSTLNSYLEKLLYLLTGNFARQGAMNIHTRMGSLGGGRSAGRRSPVGGHPIITGLVPCNVIPDEILSDHPKRFRAMIVESANPVHSLADSQRMRAAMEALDLLVVIDVAMTETARQAHYVLPAASQYEKWEAAFFTLEFPVNVFQLRPPLLERLPGTLSEPEIHARLVRAVGALSEDDLAPLRAAAVEGRAAFGAAFTEMMTTRPDLAALSPVVLYETLGPTLGAGSEAAAVLWGAAHTCAMSYPESVRRAGFEGDGAQLGEALFDAIFTRPSGVTFTVDEYEETWRRLATPDGRVNLSIPELLEELASLGDAAPVVGAEFPFVLSAGERRSSTANTIVRDPAFRKRDSTGLRMSPADAARLGIAAGARVRVVTQRGSAEVEVELSETLQAGHVTLPNGAGLTYPDPVGDVAMHGVPPNELTASEHRDRLAGTPWHKHVPARVEVVNRP
jgi:anaerobic selenocysteine-containing dehydrogenase